MLLRVVLSSLVLIFSAHNFSANAASVTTKASHAILMDAGTKTILFEKNANISMVPSSMSKLMTLYIVFERLQNKTLFIEDTLPVSKKAWRKGGSKMFVRHKDNVKIADLLRGVIVQSGNDACIVLAEGLEGSEEAFVEVMNKTAARLGLSNSHFTNATGWPDEGHVMSAADLALLAQRLMDDFPQYFNYFSQKEFTYSNIRQFNRNTLLWRPLGVDGLKTGHTEAGGYGITVTAERGDRKLILVVNGLTSEKERASEAERLLKYGFRAFENVTLFASQQSIDEANIWFGNEHTVALVSKEDILLTIPRNAIDKVKMEVHYQGPVPAPVSTEDSIAELRVTLPDQPGITVPLYAKEPVEKLSGFRHIIRSALYYLLKNKS